MATCFLVIGTPRSGTSCVAGVLHHLGIVMGRELQSEDGNPRFDWPETNDWNPAGFFQDAELENLQDAVFENEFPAAPVAALNQQHSGRLQDIINHRESLGVDWGSKTSRVPYLLPFIQQASRLPIKLIVTSRLQTESTESWKVRALCSQERADLVISRTLDALSYAKSLGLESIDMVFDDLLTSSAEQVSRLAEFCGRSVTQQAINHVNPELRRFDHALRSV